MLDLNSIRMNRMKQISSERINAKVFKLFINGEDLLYGFESDEGQATFTNKRIVIFTTTPYSSTSGDTPLYSTLAYSQITDFHITTISVPDLRRIYCELFIYTKERYAYFSFIENWDIFLVGKKISEFLLR